MDGQTILILAIIAMPILGLAVYGIRNRPNTVTGPATVESHRVEHSKVGGRWSTGWNYLVAFRLSDGDILELYTTEAEYRSLDDGQSGNLFWDGDQLVEFIPDEGAPI